MTERNVRSTAHRAALAFAALLAWLAFAGQAVAAPPEEESPAAEAPSDGFVAPKLENEATLVYPDELLDEDPRPEGTVVVKYVVGVDGVPKDLEVTESVHPVLDALAMEAVGKLRYEPATYQGQPVEVVLSTALEIVAPEPAPEPEPEPEPEVQPGDGIEYEPEPEPEDAGPVRISGQILEAGERTPVSGASIVAVPAPAGVPVGEVKKQIYEPEVEPAWTAQAITDDEGRFELRGVPDGRVRLIVVTQGFERLDYVLVLPRGEAVGVRYYQRRENRNPYKTVVETDKETMPEITRRSISVEEINTVPGTQGDALKSLQNFPGVARPPFGAGVLIIRGAAPGDSATFLAYHEIPQLFHFGGLTSVFNSDILTQIDFIPGNFDSRYGDAIGGVINVVPRAGRRDGFHGYVDSDLFDTGVLAEGPIGKGSWIISARRSYIDLLLPFAIPDDSGLDFTVAPRYWDYQALFDYPVSGGNLTARAFGSSDKLELVALSANDEEATARDAIENSVYFSRLDLSYEKKLGDWDFLVTPAYRYQSFDIAAVDQFNFNLKVNTISTRAEVSKRLSKRARLRVGTELVANRFQIDILAPPLPDGGDDTSATQQTSVRGWQIIPALYSTVTLGLTDRFYLYPGLRFAFYNQPVDRATIDPRLRFSWDLTDTTTLKGGVGLYSQGPDPAESSEDFGNPGLRPEQGVHNSLGIAQAIPYDITLEVTGFHKHIWDQIVGSPQLELNNEGEITPEIFANTGIGRIYGGEFLLRKNLTDNFYAWASYTLMRSELQSDRGEPFILFDFDQTHILTLIGSYKLPKNWQVGARFRLVTGNPYTPPDGAEFNAETGSYDIIPAPINSSRNPMFHQLDIRVDKVWLTNLFRITLYLDVQNVYNRQNSEFRNFGYNFIDEVPIPGLPIIPSIGTRIEF